MSDMLDATTAPAKRPGFLTVLCILTFIGAGLGIIGGIWNLVTLPSQIAALESMSALVAGFGAMGDEMANQIKALTEYGMISAGLGLVGSALCLFGAIKMWGQAKSGFFIYVVGQVLALVGIFLIMGTSFMAGPVAMVFPIIFIVLYALNLKHLK